MCLPVFTVRQANCLVLLKLIFTRTREVYALRFLICHVVVWLASPRALGENRHVSHSSLLLTYFAPSHPNSNNGRKHGTSKTVSLTCAEVLTTFQHPSFSPQTRRPSKIPAMSRSLYEISESDHNARSTAAMPPPTGFSQKHKPSGRTYHECLLKY